MKVIFKIVEHLTETNQVLVKFARQNAPQPIDDYSPVVVDLDNLIVDDYDLFAAGLMRYGIGTIITQELEEPTLEENMEEIVEEFSVDNLVGKVICDDTDNIERTTNYRLNKINLELL